MVSGVKVLATFAAAAVLTAGGCGGDDRSTETNPGEPSASTPSSSISSTPTVPAATGILLDNGYLSAHAPAGWEDAHSALSRTKMAISSSGPTTGSTVSVGAVPLSLLQQWPIDVQAKTMLKNSLGNLQRIAGYPRYDDRDWYHLTGSRLGKHYDTLGRNELGTTKYTIAINFIFPESLPAAARAQVIESVMATVSVEK